MKLAHTMKFLFLLCMASSPIAAQQLLFDFFVPAAKENSITKLPAWFVNNQPTPGKRFTFIAWHA